ncbi:MAG: hypothetical protein K5831_17150, partial [Brevundimonas sp.]|uniref:hypothetical protein n=1 Tax=Brevundimonas sp. TaxID=1871086 RepID=UPI00258D5B56
RAAGLLRWLMAAQTGLLPTPPTPVQINQGLSLWLDEKRGSRHMRRIGDLFTAYGAANILALCGE